MDFIVILVLCVCVCGGGDHKACKRYLEGIFNRVIKHVNKANDADRG